MAELFFLNRKDIELSAGDDFIQYIEFEQINNIPDVAVILGIRRKMYGYAEKIITPELSASGTVLKITVKHQDIELDKGVYYYNLRFNIKGCIYTPVKGRLLVR